MIVKPVGIENVVNWQDNGIFADTQKPVTDDNYTLAGDVNQDNLYVGYMKEHGLKGKLSLPVLSSLGAITGRQTIGDCEVYKHVNGTTIIKGAVINPNLPDSRISLGFSADENGLQYYNNPNDPMPIKTRNMAGLQKWEETDDYIIYVDKDAVMTTVQQYVTGTYDLFLDRKNQIDGAMELLRENGIEWTAEDDSKLLQDINLTQLERIASMPTTMDEPTEIQTFEARTVPTTYECCFRTDKKTGEIYIGEGYENYQILTGFTKRGVGEIIADTDNFFVGRFTSYGWQNQFYFPNRKGSINKNESVFTSFEIKSDITQRIVFRPNTTNGSVSVNYFAIELEKDKNYTFKCEYSSLVDGLGRHVIENPSSTTSPTVTLKNFQTTKTSTPKPFVKSVMPNGKLAFVTDATSETHSFVGKDFYFTKPGSNDACRFMYDSLGQFVFVNLKNETISNIYYSKDYRNVTKQTYNATTGMIRVYSYAQASGYTDSFKQLLIYKGNLTETELKAENEKEINVGAYYHQENSVPLTHEIDSMKSMRVYSPALTDAEITEEVNKNIYIPENRDGVPNYLGEVK